MGDVLDVGLGCMRLELLVERGHKLGDARGGEPIGACERGLGDGAGVVDLALRDQDCSEAQLTEGTASGVIVVTKPDYLLGVVTSSCELAELLHALRGLGCEGGVVKRAHPWRWTFSACLVECSLGCHQSAPTINATA
ncbi:MAG: hypothetical protein ABSG43_09385 [Solirubrobacteraceae bacterium]